MAPPVDVLAEKDCHLDFTTPEHEERPEGGFNRLTVTMHVEDLAVGERVERPVIELLDLKGNVLVHAEAEVDGPTICAKDLDVDGHIITQLRLCGERIKGELT